VLGALPRLMKSARPLYGWVLAIGIVFMALSRPVEGLILCLPVSVALGRWLFSGNTRCGKRSLIRRAAFPMALIAVSLAWLGYYDYRAFGNPLVLPYTINRATYAMSPYFVWQAPRPEPAYRHSVMRYYYEENELKVSSGSRSISGYLLAKLVMAGATIQFSPALRCFFLSL